MGRLEPVEQFEMLQRRLETALWSQFLEGNASSNVTSQVRQGGTSGACCTARNATARATIGRLEPSFDKQQTIQALFKPDKKQPVYERPVDLYHH